LPISAAEENIRQFHRDWYLDEIRDGLIPRLEAGQDVVSVFVEFYRRFARNKGDNDKKVLTETDLETFFSLCRRVAALLGEETIRQEGKGIPAHFRNWILQIKGCETEYSDSPVFCLKSLMAYEGDLLFEGYLQGGANLLWGEQGRLLPAEEAGLWEEIRYFSRPLLRFPLYRLRLPVEQIGAGGIQFFCGQEIGASSVAAARLCHMTFAGHNACLCPELGCFYGRLGALTVEYLPQEERLRFGPIGKAHILRLECSAAMALFHQPFKLPKKIREMGLRFVYFLTRPYYRKKEVWLYFDKLYMGGDNGEWLFRYAAKRLPAIRHYYVARKDAPVYAALKTAGLRVLAHNSPRNKLLALHASVLFATHSNAKGFVGLNGFERRYFAGLSRAKVVCIQHGLTIQYIPQYQGRTVDNTSLYFCAAAKEVENLSRPAYDYAPSMLRLTGLPRYDGLISKPEKLILLAPTWRRSAVVEGNKMGTAKSRNPVFQETRWYRIYAAILRDERLCEALSAVGYRLRFLLHPTVSAQFEDFVSLFPSDSPMELKAATETGYEDSLRAAALLVTDYSGIQFDFAYMDKPILYFQSPELPPTYETDLFDYEAEGFGPILRGREELVDAILKGVAHDCRQEPEYAERVAKFFLFRDNHNCERVLNVLREIFGC
jgi:hypothetical protein